MNSSTTEPTQLQKLLEQGYQVITSPLVPPGTVFTGIDPGETDVTVLAFNPYDYSYIAYSDFWMAHAVNMGKIYSNIEKMAEEALDRLDDMVEEMNHRYEPQLIFFLGDVTIDEMEDGSFSVSTQPQYRSWEEQQKWRDEYLNGGERQPYYFNPDYEAADFDGLGNEVKPSFDDILHGNGAYIDEPRDFDLFSDVEPLTPVRPYASHAKRHNWIDRMKELVSR